MRLIIYRRPHSIRPRTSASKENIEVDLNALLDPSLKEEYYADEDSAQIHLSDTELTIICRVNKKPL